MILEVLKISTIIENCIFMYYYGYNTINVILSNFKICT